MYTYMYVCVYVYLSLSLSMCIYIYIYIEREMYICTTVYKQVVAGAPRGDCSAWWRSSCTPDGTQQGQTGEWERGEISNE